MLVPCLTKPWRLLQSTGQGAAFYYAAGEQHIVARCYTDTGPHGVRRLNSCKDMSMMYVFGTRRLASWGCIMPHRWTPGHGGAVGGSANIHHVPFASLSDPGAWVYGVECK